jgi:tetratricopeptide (TPR) repeat protein
MTDAVEDWVSASAGHQQPWLGLDSFSESTRSLFHGRDEEISELARRVQRKVLTILFGQSGLGKTSILGAGLVPKLRPAGYCPVYVRVDYAAGTPTPAEQIKQAIVRETGSSGSWSQADVAVEGESLWEFLHHRDDVLRDADGRALIPLLIFDQFEEIFTLAQGDDFGRQRAAQFIEELADLVENRPPKSLLELLEADDRVVETFDFARCDYRVLIALREDYLAQLEGLKTLMPSITQNRMRLARMSGAQALQAVLNPGGSLVQQEVAEAIVRFVAGGTELRNAEVEPSLLSLICRELNAARIALGRAEISTDLLAGSHATILAEFYQRALADQPPGVHRFIEEELLTEGGFRENVAQERVLKAFAEAGAKRGALAQLVDRRLLRVEERLDTRRVELTHDVLCSIVRASREARHEREAREAAEQQLAAQKLHDEATRRALVRARRVAAGCIALAAAAVGAGIFGIWGMKRAQQAEVISAQTLQLAEQGRSQSERLIVYLLDHFYRELEPVGRLDLVADLANRAIAYSNDLPEALRTPETARNRAVAQVRLAAVLRAQGKLADAQALVSDAIGTLEQRVSGGDRSEPTLVGLSVGLSAQAAIVESTGIRSAAIPLAARAVSVLAVAAQSPQATAGLRRTLAAALSALGRVQMRQYLPAEGAGSLERSLAVLRGLAPGEITDDPNVAAAFAVTSNWLTEAYLALDRRDDARTIATEGLKIASQVLERRPTHSQALVARALLLGSLAGVSEADLRLTIALSLRKDMAHAWRALVSSDPMNGISWGNLAVARRQEANGLLRLGRPREALAALNRNSDVEASANHTGANAQLWLTHAQAAYIAGDVGATPAVQVHSDKSERFMALFLKGMKPGSFDAEMLLIDGATLRHGAAVAAGDQALMWQAAGELKDRLAALKPTPDQSLRVSSSRVLVHRSFGRAALLRGDDRQAVAEFEAALEHRTGESPTGEEQRQALDDDTMHATALARLGRRAESLKRIAEPLRLLRELEARNTDDVSLRTSLIQALYAASLAESDGSKSRLLLAEARRGFDALPTEVQRYQTLRWWHQRLGKRLNASR